MLIQLIRVYWAKRWDEEHTGKAIADTSPAIWTAEASAK